MTPPAHIIGTQVLDVEIDVGEDFFALQKEVSRVFQARVAPALDALFSRYVGADRVIRLDRLEVDVGRIDRSRLEDELTTRIVEALEPMLAACLDEVASSARASSWLRPGARRPADEADARVREATGKSAVEAAAPEGDDAGARAVEGDSDGTRGIEERAVGDRVLADRADAKDVVEKPIVEGPAVAKGGIAEGGITEGSVEKDGFGSRSVEGHTIELWHFFLQNGHFPWWAPPLEPSAFEARVMQALEAQPALLVQTWAVVQRAPVALQRLVLQSSDAFLDHLVRAYTPALSPRLFQVAQGFARWAAAHPASGIGPRAFREVFWQEALHGVFTGQPDAAPRAEQTVARRALQRLSRRLGVPYPDLLARIQATVQQEERDAVADSARLVRRLVQALASSARVAEAAEQVAAPSDEVYPPRAPEETRRPEQAAPSEAEARRTPSEADAERRPDRDAPADRPAEEEQRFLEGGEPQREALTRTVGEESKTPGAPSERSSLEERPFLEDRPLAKPIKEGANLYLHNAGLVLLHPYLTAHFEHLGLLHEKAFVDEDARHQAIYQLQYLATGRAQALEYSLTLNKLLCGHPQEDPLARDLVLGDAAEAEAEDLLRAVIRNWPALKNTSPDGLREGFLQREGKLTRKPFNWLLQVEQKSHDILLGRLPWGIGIVKLPWMPEMLHVEWA